MKYFLILITIFQFNTISANDNTWKPTSNFYLDCSFNGIDPDLGIKVENEVLVIYNKSRDMMFIHKHLITDDSWYIQDYSTERRKASNSTRHFFDTYKSNKWSWLRGSEELTERFIFSDNFFTGERYYFFDNPERVQWILNRKTLKLVGKWDSLDCKTRTQAPHSS